MSKNPEDSSLNVIEFPKKFIVNKDMSPVRQRNRAVFFQIKTSIEKLKASVSELRSLISNTINDPKSTARIGLLRRTVAEETGALLDQLLFLQSDSDEADKLNLSEMDLRYLERGKFTENAIERYRIYVENYLEQSNCSDL